KKWADDILSTFNGKVEHLKIKVVAADDLVLLANEIDLSKLSNEQLFECAYYLAIFEDKSIKKARDYDSRLEDPSLVGEDRINLIFDNDKEKLKSSSYFAIQS